MNDRIKDLATQAIVENITSDRWVFNDAELEKFAELIVKECVTIVTDAVDHREPASTYASKIQQHFGVK